jgi:hypothetical protein
MARESERAVRRVGGIDDSDLLSALFKLWRRIDALVPPKSATPG